MMSYDEIPYPTLPRFQTHPNRLAVLARLFGMNPPPVERCRVLDLGCGDGSNLIPMAYQLSQSEFVGIDLSSKQVTAGQAQISELGLKNIALDVMDILDVDTGLGQFDYIMAYGVYSWAPPGVQQKILEICRQQLTAQGVAYISYNVYPGWHMMGLVRELMLYHTRHIDDPYARVKKARDVLDFLVETMPLLTKNPSDRLRASRLLLESVQELLRDQPDEYVLHDQLEVINEPLYFHQFVERAQACGLQYLSDAETSSMLTAFLPAEFAQSLQSVAQTNLDVEQFMDFLYSRSFRQSLLCHADITLDREHIVLDQWRTLYIASAAKPVNEALNLRSSEMEKFQGTLGTSLTTGQPLNKAALLYLAEVWPRAVSFETLLRGARSRLNPVASQIYSAADFAQDAQRLVEILLKGFALGLVDLGAYQPAFVAEISDYPELSVLARFQMQSGNQVTNQRHEIVVLEDEVGRYLAPYLDGKHDRAALLGVLADLVAQGILMVQPDGVIDEDLSGEDAKHLDNILTEVLDQSLHKLAQDALLVG